MSQAPQQTTYTITELAKEFSITTRTIRFYEDQGLLNPHREGRRRVYGNRDRTRLKLILRGKRLGFSLGEIRALFDLFDTARGEEKQLRHFVKMLKERRAILRQQQRDIEAILYEIDSAETECLRLLQEKAAYGLEADGSAVSLPVQDSVGQQH